MIAVLILQITKEEELDGELESRLLNPKHSHTHKHVCAYLCQDEKNAETYFCP